MTTDETTKQEPIITVTARLYSYSNGARLFIEVETELTKGPGSVGQFVIEADRMDNMLEAMQRELTAAKRIAITKP